MKDLLAPGAKILEMVLAEKWNADQTGFEPAISCVTGKCIKPDYATDP